MNGNGLNMVSEMAQHGMAWDVMAWDYRAWHSTARDGTCLEQAVLVPHLCRCHPGVHPCAVAVALQGLTNTFS